MDGKETSNKDLDLATLSATGAVLTFVKDVFLHPLTPTRVFRIDEEEEEEGGKSAKPRYVVETKRG